MGSGWLNVESLVLGLAAWVLPVIALAWRGKGRMLFSIASMGACAVSLYLQILETSSRVRLEDWSALMDTFGAVVFASTALLVVTLLLNAAVLGLMMRKNRNENIKNR